MKITLDDGTALSYDESGRGSSTLLFVHGWLCNRSFFAPQFEYFSSRHRVVSVDLRGHGDSDKPRQAYHPDLHAKDLVQFCEKLGIQRPVVVGHSMGGVIGLRLAFLYPTLLSALVGLDSVWIMTPEIVALGLQLGAALERNNYQDTLSEFIEPFFLPTDDPERHDMILRVMTGAPQEVMVSGWSETIQNTNTLEALASLSVPTLYVAAPTQPGGLEEIRAAANVTIGQTVGSGHFIQLECPDQVNAMIARFLYVNELA